MVAEPGARRQGRTNIRQIACLEPPHAWTRDSHRFTSTNPWAAIWLHVCSTSWFRNVEEQQESFVVTTTTRYCTIVSVDVSERYPAPRREPGAPDSMRHPGHCGHLPTSA